MTRNRVLILLAAFIAVALVLLYILTRPAEISRPDTLAALKPAGKPAPAAPLTLIGVGKPENLGAYHGRYVLLNLWASWCPPCVRELPALARLQQALPKDRFAVVTVDAEHNATAATAATFLGTHGATNLPPFADGDLKVSQALHVYGMPTTVLIDPNGNEAARAVGTADWDAPASIAYFKALAEAESKAH